MPLFFSSTDAQYQAPLKKIDLQRQRRCEGPCSTPRHKRAASQKQRRMRVLARLSLSPWKPESLGRVQGPLVSSKPFETACLLGCRSAQWRWFQGNANVATKIVHNSALWCTIVVATITLPCCSENYLALP